MDWKCSTGPRSASTRSCTRRPMIARVIRISQRAVENIGSIGGGGAGVTAALSERRPALLRRFPTMTGWATFLSVAERSLCHGWRGARRANGNYYLVKGRGLPRIDVIGSSRRVDWPRLVEQLLARRPVRRARSTMTSPSSTVAHSRFDNSD